MADETKRVIDQTTDQSLSAGDFIIVDSQSEGTRKFDLGTELTGIKQDLAELEGGGLTADLKAALDQLAQKVAYIDEGGQNYYDALHAALYPPANLTRISCVYTQSGTVYDTDSLDDLKTDLVVTAHFSDSTTQTVTTYTLSGTLAEGTSTITVAYSGKTTTFNVTVTAVPKPWEDGVPYETSAFLPSKADTYLTIAGVESAYNGWQVLNYVDCEGASTIEVTGINLDARYSSFYNSSQVQISNLNANRVGSTTTYTVPSGTKYFRISSINAQIEQLLDGTATVIPHA